MRMKGHEIQIKKWCFLLRFLGRLSDFHFMK